MKESLDPVCWEWITGDDRGEEGSNAFMRIAYITRQSAAPASTLCSEKVGGWGVSPSHSVVKGRCVVPGITSS